MKIEIGIGKEVQEVTVPDDNLLEVLYQNELDHTGALTEEEEICRALHEPVGSPRLKEIVKPGEKVVIVTSDITRPMPTWKVLPFLLEELEAGGARLEDITLVYGLGSHRKQTEEERRKLAGEEVFQKIRCIDGDPLDHVRLGVTSRGTPVDIVREVAQADRRVCLGNIEYHYFAGYSGGAKAIMPGVSTREAIQNNHRMMTDPRCCAGNLKTNPLRADIEEAEGVCPVDFILNVVLDEHKRIVKAVAGDVRKAHRVGCTFLDMLYQKRIGRCADIVLVSQGGAPKDLNLYQTQKALDNAKHAIKEGGIIILVGSCREGMGEETFEKWLLEAKKPEDLIQRIRSDFRLGGHKAAAIAMVLQKAQIYLVSDLEQELVRQIFMQPFETVQAALDHAFAEKGEDATVLVMPFGGSTLPVVSENEEIN